MTRISGAARCMQNRAALLSLQHQRHTAVWSVNTQQAQGFVAVTPMQWPGTPKTPATQVRRSRHLLLPFEVKDKIVPDLLALIEHRCCLAPFISWHQKFANVCMACAALWSMTPW